MTHYSSATRSGRSHHIASVTNRKDTITSSSQCGLGWAFLFKVRSFWAVDLSQQSAVTTCKSTCGRIAGVMVAKARPAFLLRDFARRQVNVFADCPCTDTPGARS